MAKFIIKSLIEDLGIIAKWALTINAAHIGFEYIEAGPKHNVFVYISAKVCSIHIEIFTENSEYTTNVYCNDELYLSNSFDSLEAALSEIESVI